MSWNRIAAGLFASHPNEVEGATRIVVGLQEIVKFMREPPGELAIVVTNVAGGSAVSTIIRRAKAIVSTIGGPNSHVVVVARDYQMPCIVSAAGLDLAAIKNGMRMRLQTDGGIEVWSEESADLRPDQMQLLRSIVFAGALQSTEDIIEFEGDVDRALSTLESHGLIETGSLIAPTPAGIDRLNSWYARAREHLDEGQRGVLHAEFRSLDRELKRISSDWQKADAQDDWDNRLKAIESLSALHTNTLALFERFSHALPHLEEFRKRLTGALQKVVDGETNYFVGVRVDSYHTVWFNLHEDLLRLLNRERDPE